ncbi:hypothetical protein FE784_29785 [Paenibacillus hemerocallicola]|uniref:HTH hxlR-type domain-containing protein n=1 Tax=Paenibacillus hemerocallicola TaxID=1172614 RepID=A0A5C4T0H1_9BACL|nr:winged helix-turn-helix transcriptional regulator [Paenibacillus hemerocallicola]TNJ62608.1 hypothetical protein FE784_29785 [Paenibacillus hemerocallicola]
MNKKRTVLEISQQLSGRWTIPILLELESSGGRFTPLQKQLEITPARLSDNLKQLSEVDLVRHLTPYERRHPLLPEYTLTEKGKLYREAAKAIRSSEAKIGHGALSAKAWNMPVLVALHFHYERFQEIRRVLHSVTPRMLSTRLDELHGEELILKHFSEQSRPSFVYELSAQAVKPIERMTSDIATLVM